MKLAMQLWFKFNSFTLIEEILNTIHIINFLIYFLYRRKFFKNNQIKRQE